MIDPHVVDTFERDGFVILPNILDAQQIDQLIAAGDRLVASDLRTMRQTQNDGRYDGFRNCIALDPAFMQLLAHPAILPYLLRLLGPGIQLLTSHLIYQQSEPAGAVPSARTPGWHRDFAKVSQTLDPTSVPRLDIKCAFYLTDVTEPGSGATHFARGSHRLTERLHIPDDRDPDTTVEPSLRPGDCVLFENRTWHTAGRNLSGRTRKVVMMGYTYTWVKPSDYTTQPPELCQLAAQQYGDIGLQLLGGLDAPEGFDFNYDTAPLRAYAATHTIPGPYA